MVPGQCQDLQSFIQGPSYADVFPACHTDPTVGPLPGSQWVYDVGPVSQQPVPGPQLSDLALTPLCPPSRPLGCTSASPTRLSAPWGWTEALVHVYFQPRAWHTVGARGGPIMGQESRIQLDGGHGVTQSGSLVSSLNHTFVLQALSQCTSVPSQRGDLRVEKKGRGMENWGVGKCGGWREGRTGVGATVPGQRVLGQMPRASPASPGGPAFQETRPVDNRLTSLSKQRSC